jgi:hypothetical protein
VGKKRHLNLAIMAMSALTSTVRGIGTLMPSIVMTTPTATVAASTLAPLLAIPTTPPNNPLAIDVPAATGKPKCGSSGPPKNYDLGIHVAALCM